MTTGLSFYAIARRCEIAEFEQLALTGELLAVVRRLIHALQLERGLSGLFVGAQTPQITQERAAQVALSDQAIMDLRHWFGGLEIEATAVGGRARLFNRIAYAVDGLQALTLVRGAVTTLAWNAQQTCAAYSRVIAALLAVVCEAVDSATDPDVSRLLVALFHYMHAKERAGQERAIGCALFGAGVASFLSQRRLKEVIEAQEHGLAIFEIFAPTAILETMRAAACADNLATLERERRGLLTVAPGTPLDGARGVPWFDTCTRRIEAMRLIEDGLQQALVDLCSAKVDAAKMDLTQIQGHLAGGALVQASRQGATAFDALDPEDPLSSWADAPHGTDSMGGDRLGPRLERSVLDLVQEQSRRLQAMREELEEIRSTLDERKVIERAKGLLMALRRLSEEQAHRTLRQMAMNRNRRLVDIAEAVLTLSEMLGDSLPRD